MSKEQKQFKEITIAYGNEVQLTTVGKTNKQVFLKFSPAFREKQLSDLKGAPLSVFLCYALHTDENGYTWVDNKVIIKETGYSEELIMKAKNKLRENGYLFQERLFDKGGKFRDWIYRIFQPIEENKIFTIRGIDQKPLIKENPYIGEIPNQGKSGGTIEEEPLINKEEPKISSSDSKQNKEKKHSEIYHQNKQAIEKMYELGKIPSAIDGIFDWKWCCKNALKMPHLLFIALYWKQRDYKFDNREEAGGEIVRITRKASEYAEKYKVNKFVDMLAWMEQDSHNKGGYTWTFETIDKKVAEFNFDKAPTVL